MTIARSAGGNRNESIRGAAMSKPEFIYEVSIKAPAERIWEALTNGEFTRQYFYATTVESDWEPGGAIEYVGENGTLAAQGEVLECNPPTRLAFTWRALWDPGLAREAASRVTFTIEPGAEVCKLRVVHDRFPPDSRVYDEVAGGWPAILSGLRSLLETGRPLVVAGNP